MQFTGEYPIINSVCILKIENTRHEYSFLSSTSLIVYGLVYQMKTFSQNVFVEEFVFIQKITKYRIHNIAHILIL